MLSANTVLLALAEPASAKPEQDSCESRSFLSNLLTELVDDGYLSGMHKSGSTRAHAGFSYGPRDFGTALNCGKNLFIQAVDLLSVLLNFRIGKGIIGSRRGSYFKVFSEFMEILCHECVYWGIENYRKTRKGLFLCSQSSD